jgi:hypothetical protein
MEFLILFVSGIISLLIMISIFQLNSRVDRLRATQTKSLDFQEQSAELLLDLYNLEKAIFMQSLIEKQQLSDAQLNSLQDYYQVLSDSEVEFLTQVLELIESK